ncbi:cytochrome c [Frigidibacter sp. RF13]|uniref:c-type cytochrome n=1 Tax=Frigidibacter sp. RF13 TaxID=2997340 RepID=UPI002271FFFD|nr:cytochrome c [Frigidibacter sp. RF13]MCY1125319.1 cytochrome c [Frigidibacter sp. RF13]
MKKIVAGTAIALLSMATIGLAEEEGPFANEIEARQGLMVYRAINIGTLAAMAKGEAEYDAAKAATAANALLASANLDVSMLWPPGSDNAANPDSTASAAIWADGSDIGAKAGAFKAAAEAMAAAAGTDLASLQGAMGDLGGSCGGCHKAFRVPTN